MDNFGKFDLGIDDIGVSVWRVDGIWQDPEFTGCVLPKELHHAQRLIGKHYQGYRKKIAKNFNQAKSREKKKEAEKVEKERLAKERDRAAEELDKKKLEAGASDKNDKKSEETQTSPGKELTNAGTK